jgi:hypothetical protein
MNTPTPHQLAAELAQIIAETPPHLVSRMARAYQLVNTAGMEQEIFDALPAFGVVPARAVQTYAVLRGALESLGLAADLPAADTDKFTANADGSVTVTLPEPVTLPAPTTEP